jgi:Zn-dependent protease with chaperone function
MSNALVTAKRQRVRLPFLSTEAFVSETDRQALARLQKVPLLPTVLKKYNEMALDTVEYVNNASGSVRCSPRQIGSVYALLREACAIVDVPEPELYVRYSAVYNAYTSGMQRTHVVLHSALVDDFTDDELLYVIGHELGHIKCGHLLYKMVGANLILLLEALGQYVPFAPQFLAYPLVAAFFEWSRQAEFSCDRLGLLTCQDPKVAQQANMKLGCGHTRFQSEANVDEFVRQAREYSDMGGAEGIAKVLLFLQYKWRMDHPEVVLRAKLLDEWVQSGAYDRILALDYPRTEQTSILGKQATCPKCKKPASANVQYCTGCGTDLQSGQGGPTLTIGASNLCTGCRQPVPPGASFCPHCGRSF